MQVKTMPLYRTLPIEIKEADSFFLRLKGLMFRKVPIQKEGLHIVPCNSIHMFFMNFPIDIVFLDKKQQIVKTIENLKPWKMAAPVKNAHSVVELPAGTIERFSLKAGEYIKM